MIRLDRLLSSRGYCTRSQARAFLQRHAVVASGTQQFRPDEKVDGTVVTIDGEPVDPETLVILMNKPVGYTCSHKEQGELVYDLLPQRWMRRNPTIATVGRLDKDTSGVLILTDDGQLVRRLTHPKHHVARVYVAKLAQELRGDEREIFASGTLMLEGEDRPLLPGELEVVDSKTARLTVHEGRYHQVRRMFAATGNRVLELHRERFGRVDCDGLSPGEYRVINAGVIVR
jgi:16S rRNA pseudouridine516 synthase